MSSEQQVPIVDLRNLAQTDIQRLATSNSSYFNIESLLTVIPIIDPSTFNESASSRKQTFSRLPLKTNSKNAVVVPDSNARRVGRPVNPSPSLGRRPRNDDEENKENLQIVSTLKNLFAIREKGESIEKLDGETRNLNGEEIDLEELGKKVDLYDEVIRGRTEGLEKEDELLGYMTALDGVWVSSRKKRKIVDAGVFGCELPKGWKVLLGLKRKNKQVFLHCREYVSPSGKHFASCKAVSSYILFLNGQHDSSQQTSAQHALPASETAKALVNVTNQTDQDVNKLELGNCSYVTPISYISTECEKQGQLFNNTDRPENSLQCQRCNLTFVDEDAKSRHLSTFHGSNKRRRLGQSSTESINMKDGKYECQLCCKTYTEKHRYNRHIGAHKRHGSLKKGNGGVIESASSIGNSSASLIPYDQSKKNIFVDANAEASMHDNSTENITEAVSKEGEHHLNESVTEGSRDISNSTLPSPMPCDQPKVDITVKQNAEVSTHNDCAKRTTEAVSKESEHNLDESVKGNAEASTHNDSAKQTTEAVCKESEHNLDESVKESAEVSTHNDSAKHTTEAVSKESEHNLDESVKENAEPSTHNDSAKHTTEAVSKESEHNLDENVKENAEVSTHNDSAKHTTGAVSKESEHNLDESVKENAEVSTHNDSVKHTTEAVSKESEHNLDESVKENAEASTHNDSAKHTTEAASKESGHNLDESVIVDAMDISISPSASLRPCDQSKNNVSTNENAEASSLKDSDSAKHITEAVSNTVSYEANACMNSLSPSLNNINELEGIAGFDDLSLGSIDPSDFTLFPEQLEWGMSFDKNPTNSAPTVVCAWCSREFILQGYETDAESGSLGYICPCCKAQISGHAGMFNDGFP